MTEQYQMPLSPDDGRLAPEEARDIISALVRSESDPAYSIFWPSLGSLCVSSTRKRTRIAQEENARKEDLVRCYDIVPAAFTPDGGRAEVAYMLIDIADRYGKDREVVEGALSYLDRTLLNLLKGAAPPNLRSLLRFALACFALSVKLLSPCSGHPFRGHQVNELNKSLNIKLDHTCAIYDRYGPYSSLVAESRGLLLSAEKLASTEVEICSLLKFKLHSPTAAAFIQRFLELVVPQGDDDAAALDWVKQVALHQSELALGWEVVLASPSIIAVAAVRNAVRFFCLQLEAKGTDVQCPKLLELQAAIDSVMFAGKNEGGSTPDCDGVQDWIWSIQRTLKSLVATQQPPPVNGENNEPAATSRDPMMPKKETLEGTSSNEVDTPPLVSETKDFGTNKSNVTPFSVDDNLSEDNLPDANTDRTEKWGTAEVHPSKRLRSD